MGLFTVKTPHDVDFDGFWEFGKNLVVVDSEIGPPEVVEKSIYFVQKVLKVTGIDSIDR